MSAGESVGGIDQWRDNLRVTLANVPSDYAAQVAAAKALRQTFHQELAAAIGPALNAYLKTQPQESYADKRKLVAWVNHELRELGLAIFSSKTMAPAILVSDFRNTKEQSSRFRLESRNSAGHIVRSSTSKTVPPLDLVEDVRRQDEPLAKYRK